MHALSSSELLDLWEAGQGRSHVERGLLLLRAARPDLDHDACLDMPIGQRDAHLLAVRTATFGRDAALLASCPRCGERLELELPLGALDQDPYVVPASCQLEHGAHRVRFRLPTSRDLWSLRCCALGAELEDAAGALATRCLLEVEPATETLPAALLEAVAERMHDADPRAYVSAALTCPACSCSFSEPLDLVACLWSELSAHAVRALREVHALASRYGWDEPTVLRLSPTRRRLYLEMASA